MMVKRVTSRTNPLVQTCVKLARDRAFRRETELALGDGPTLLGEASPALIQTVIAAPGVDLPPLDGHVERVEVPDSLLDYLSPSKTPEGVVFIVKWPAIRRDAPPSGGRHIYLERVQDPGNVGSILRSARAFGLAAAHIDAASADPFSPKALRASMGASFHVPIVEVGDADVFFDACMLRVYAAVPSESAVPIRDVPWDNTITLLGNEGSGLSAHLLGRANQKIRVPMAAGCESLGVAACAAVILWEMTRCV